MDKNKVRKLLTLDDLCDYYSNHKNKVTYNAEKNYNSPVVVQVEAKMTFSEDDYDPELSLMRTHLKSCHIGTNRNHSRIEQSVMEEAATSIYNRPILGFIHQLSDGSYDFAGHEMFINEDGEIEYEEIPVGCVPESGNAHLVYDKENDKTYLEVDGVIFEEYTRAAQILKEKKESKVSVELNLLEFSYDPKQGELVIDKFYFSGITILGKTRGGEEPIEEGMYGSKITLKDFKQNNSMFTNISEQENNKLIETLEALNKTLTEININKAEFSADEISEEGGTEDVDNEKVLELLEKYNKTEADIEFEIEGLSDDELEAKFAEVFGEESEEDPTSEEGDEVEVTETHEEAETETSEDSVEDETTEVVETESEEVTDESVEESAETAYELIEKSFEVDGKKFSVSFTLSHEDIRYGLYNLLETYSDLDNDWYGIRAVYDDHFVMQGWCSGKIYGQKYTVDGDTVAFDGERWELFEELLTASEKAELESMRSNYSLLAQFKEDTEKAQLHAQREEVLSNEKYSVLAEKDENNEYKNEAYAKLVSEMDNYSLADLEKELKSVFADYITNGGQFAYNGEPEKPVSKKLFAISTGEKPSRYGNLFKDK